MHGQNHFKEITDLKSEVSLTITFEPLYTAIADYDSIVFLQGHRIGQRICEQLEFRS